MWDEDIIELKEGITFIELYLMMHFKCIPSIKLELG
jgi:hypothetical protein